MKKYSAMFLFFLCIVVIFVGGCTNQTGSTESTPAPIPTTSIPTTAITSVISTSIIPTTTNITAMTLSPQADPTDASEIAFLHYSDSDFSIDYPSTWTITKSTYTSYDCRNSRGCFENETKSIGPFYFYDSVNRKKLSRIVTFTSADGKLKFVSFISDFLDRLNGNFMLKPTGRWVILQFESRYPDLRESPYVSDYDYNPSTYDVKLPECSKYSPSDYLGAESRYPGSTSSTYVSDYKYFLRRNTMVSTYDVELPIDPKYSPSAYTVKTIVTVHHVYSFGFLTDNENFTKYQNLKEKMISSITIGDIP